MDNQYEYIFDNLKNLTLMEERGISFDEVIRWIEEGKIIETIAHPNQRKYPNQKIYVIKHEDYVYNVPFVEQGEKIFLKTAFPSRKMKKRYANKEVI